MSINLTDNKFGLPKPDFQALPKKRVIWPLLVIVGIVLILIATKLSYHYHFKMVKNPISSAETVNNRSTTDPVTDSSSASPSQATPRTEVDTNVNGATHQSLCSAKTFEHKKVTK